MKFRYNTKNGRIRRKSNHRKYKLNPKDSKKEKKNNILHNVIENDTRSCVEYNLLIRCPAAKGK